MQSKLGRKRAEKFFNESMSKSTDKVYKGTISLRQCDSPYSLIWENQEVPVKDQASRNLAVSVMIVLVIATFVTLILFLKRYFFQMMAHYPFVDQCQEREQQFANNPADYEESALFDLQYYKYAQMTGIY